MNQEKNKNLLFVSFVAGFYGAALVATLKDKKQKRRKQRFDWYRKTGLLESAILIEPKLSKKYWMAY